MLILVFYMSLPQKIHLVCLNRTSPLSSSVFAYTCRLTVDSLAQSFIQPSLFLRSSVPGTFFSPVPFTSVSCTLLYGVHEFLTLILQHRSRKKPNESDGHRFSDCFVATLYVRSFLICPHKLEAERCAGATPHYLSTLCCSSFVLSLLPR